MRVLGLKKIKPKLVLARAKNWFMGRIALAQVRFISLRTKLLEWVKKRLKLVARWFTSVRVVGLILGIIGLVASILIRLKLLDDFYLNFSSGFIDIAITVILIDWLNERRDQKRYKNRLIRDMSSADQGIALRAVRELRDNKWLHDGTLCGASFFSANLKQANLSGASLRGAGFWRANLEDANLRKADLRDAYMFQATLQGASLRESDLQGAEVSIEQLQEAKTLQGTILPDGTELPGRGPFVNDDWRVEFNYWCHKQTDIDVEDGGLNTKSNTPKC